MLRGRTVDGGTVLLETYGIDPEDRNGPAICVSEPGEVYAHDDFIYWGFTNAGLERLARIAGFSRADSLINVEVDGHPRILGQLIAYVAAPGTAFSTASSQPSLEPRDEQARTCRQSRGSAPGATRPPLRSRRTPRAHVSGRRPRWNPPGPTSVRGPAAPGQASVSSKPGPITLRCRTMSDGRATTL